MNRSARATSARPGRGPIRGCAVTLAAVVGLGLPIEARTAPPRAEVRNPTDGVERVYKDYSGEGDASSIELNPALLGTVRGLDFGILGYDAVSDFARGSGIGTFLALGFRFGLALGFGAQIVRPGLGDGVADFDADANPDITKLSFGLATGLGEHGTFGVALHGIRGQGEWLQRPALDVGMLTRVFNYGSLGVDLQLSPVDLHSDLLPAQMSLVGEAAVRPLGTHHLELAGGLRAQLLEASPGEGLRNVGVSGLLPRGRLSVRFHGLALRGEVEQVRTVALDEQTLAPLREEKAVRGSVSLEASWDFVSVGGGVRAGVSDGLDGYGVHARLHTTRRGRVYWSRRVDIERLRLADVEDERGLIAMLRRIERAEQAGARSVLLVDARGLDLGWASLHELREALIRVRNAGGHVFAYLEGAALEDYYLASVAEKVLLHPAGSLEIVGLASTSFYFKEALDKIGVRAEVIKVDEYKSAGERFTETAPSPSDREQREALLDDIYTQVVRDIAQARGLTIAEVRRSIDTAPHGPQEALEAGLVDAVVHRDEIKKRISEDIGAEVDFNEFHDTSPRDLTWSEAPYVAVVLVEGTIVDGPSRYIPLLDLDFTGGDTIAQTLRDVRDDPFCKGIVLRVNSPGGSALASDIIWREVQRTVEAHREDPRGSPPLVVSMGDVAASGGYYVSTAADTILADPMTITGSIGVISINVDASGLLRKLGISTATFQRGDNANLGSPWAPLEPRQREILEASIRRTYRLFVDRVAKGRDLTPERVDEIGRGRVWSGTDAKDVDLVDRFGGLADAIALVRERAKVPAFRTLEIRVLPKRRRLVDIILGDVDEPFASTIEKVGARRRAGKGGAALREAMPPALDRTLSAAPLSTLYLEPKNAHAIMPWQLR